MHRFFYICYVGFGEKRVGRLRDFKRDAVFTQYCFYKKVNRGGGIQSDIGAESVKMVLSFSSTRAVKVDSAIKITPFVCLMYLLYHYCMLIASICIIKERKNIENLHLSHNLI